MPKRPCTVGMDAVDDITTAVELKFLVALVPLRVNPSYIDEDNSQRYPSIAAEEEDFRRQAYTAIAEVIREIPRQKALTAFEIQERRLQDRDLWKSHWVVKKANSAEPAKEDQKHRGFILLPVEVTSPKLTWKDSKHILWVEAVLARLHSRFTLVSNHTCEVHVHVGRRDGTLFALRTMKRLATLLWLAEPILRGVKDPKSPNFDHVFTWSSALREHSRLALALKSGDYRFLSTGDPEEYASFVKTVGCLADKSLQSNALRAIWGAKSHVELGKMMSGSEKRYRRLGFNFSALAEEDERAKTGPKTIEVRFLEGALGTDIVIGWLKICCLLVEVSTLDDGSQSIFRHSVRKLLRGLDYLALDQAFEELMEEMRVDKDVYAPLQGMILQNHGHGVAMDLGSRW